MTEFLSFEPLINMIDELATKTQALERGNEKFLAYLPELFKQTINKLASERLDHTREAFKEGVMYEDQGDLFVVVVRPGDWLASAVDAGANGWAMVSTHLRGSKTKMSKEGYRYKVIPIRVWGASSSAKTDKGMDFYEKAKQTLKKPQIRPGSLKMKTHADSSVTVRQEVLSDFSELRGMERIRDYKSISDFQQNLRPSSSKFVLFRTMSEKFPEKFVHPGIQARNILKDAQTEVEGKLESIWESMVQNEINGVKK